MPILNLGILAHVDAGKTSLTERILFETGVIATVGRVDKGDTQTDTLALERERGITIQSAVVSFQLGDLKVNLIDTPGHTDFVAEVERALRVLDGVILVVSAVEGVQAQTRKLARAVRALGLPLLLAINKIDRAGARTDSLLADIRARLGLRVVAMDSVVNPGTRHVAVAAANLPPRDRLLDLLAEQSDRLIADYVATGGRIPLAAIAAELRAQVADGRVVPVFYTSATRGVGVDRLLDGIARWLPAAPAASEAALEAEVFKIQRDPAGRKLVYLRLWQGSLAVRQRVVFRHRAEDGTVCECETKLTGIDRFHDGTACSVPRAFAGDIVRVHGLSRIQIGDTIGRDPRGAGDRRFALPPLESVIRADEPTQSARLYLTLQRMAEQDPFISIRRGASGEITVRLYGEVQKEVIAATLANDGDLAVTFTPSRIVCIERPRGSGEAVELMGESPFYAAVGLRVEPAAPMSGVVYHRELGSLPPAFYTAIEETIFATLQEGLYGWRVQDCVVTLTHVAFSSPVSTAGDFRKLTPLVLMRALQAAGTVVCEPIERFTLDVPDETVGEVLAALVAARAVPEETMPFGAACRIAGTIPTAEVQGVEQGLPRLGKGEAVFSSTFDHYDPLARPYPTRIRTDFNPLNRAEYLARVSQA